MRRSLVFAVAVAGLIAGNVAAAQNETSPGVENPLPGVWVVHPDKVSSLGVDRVALEVAIKDKKPFSVVREQLGGDGFASPGPANTTVHIYKAHDTATAQNLDIILFVKDDVIVNHMVVDAPPKPSTGNQQPQQ